MRALLAVVFLAACAKASVATPTPPAPPAFHGPVDHVVVVSVDGLKPESYLRADELGLKVPLFREMLAGGAHADAVRGVYPTVTYPSHTSIVTGVEPGKHGIVANLAFDPTDTNLGGWRWYAEDLAARTVYQAVDEAGGKTALVFWPVTVGAKADFLLPEVWRASNGEDQKLLRALATPGLLEGVQATYPDLWKKITPQHTSDEGTIDVASWLIEHEQPNLLLVHIFQTDDAQHDFGPGSPEALAAIEHADAQVARLVASAKKAGIWERSVLVLVSDHGFRKVNRRFRPGVVLRDLGLVGVVGDKVTDWKVGTLCSGGQAYLYLADPADQASARQAEDAFRALAGKPGSGVRAVRSHDEIVAAGGDPRAFLALDAEDGFYFGHGAKGEAYAAAGIGGHHGFDPGDPEMAASLLVYGAGIPAGTSLAGARLVDVAPTVAKLLGVELPGTTGKPLL